MTFILDVLYDHFYCTEVQNLKCPTSVNSDPHCVTVVPFQDTDKTL